jgi:hypothetical protein
VLSFALQLGDSSLAAAAAIRWVQSPQIQPADRDETPLMTQGKRLLTVVDLYLNRQISTLSFATTLASLQPFVHYLDSLGAPVRTTALEARAAIILAQVHDAKRMGQWKPDQTLHLVRDFLQRSDAVAPADWPPPLIMWRLLEVALRARGFEDPHGAMAFYDSLRAHSPSVAFVDTVESGLIAHLLREQYLTPLNMVGKVAPAVTGTYWFHASGLTVSNNTWPTPGRVSLLMTVTTTLGLGEAAMLRRLAAQYGTQGLSITIVTKTHGYWLKDGSRTGPVSPAEEAADDSAYYLDYLHLPVTLMVDSSTFIRDSEQRLRQATPVAFESAYGSQNGMIVLTDRTGYIVVSDVIANEARLSAYVRRALGQ